MIKRFKEVEGNFKEIPGVDEHYLISTEGVLISIRHGVKVLKGYRDTDGYRCFKHIPEWGGPSKHYRISRLVALAWIPQVEGKEFVLHGDGQKDNNTVSNLRWGTAKENMEDAAKHGVLGRKGHQAKLSPQKAIAIRQAHKLGQSIRSLSMEYHVGRNTIRQLLLGNTWKHVGA